MKNININLTDEEIWLIQRLRTIYTPTRLNNHGAQEKAMFNLANKLLKAAEEAKKPIEIPEPATKEEIKQHD